MNEPNIQAGDRARKIGGSYQADGTIVSVFKTKAGKWRVVFEFDSPVGLLHVFDISQIKKLGNRPRSSFMAYRSWKMMRYRCLNKSCKSYRNYGGRGIAICDRWKEFKNFLADMGERPSKHHSLERIDNNSSYSPENCKWATRDEQSRNMRSNRWIEKDGEKMVVSDWEKRLGFKNGVILYRIKNGWTESEALEIRPVYKARIKVIQPKE